jgi:hypothetical protein
MSRRRLGFAVMLVVVGTLVAPVGAKAAWVEPVVGPLNQTNAFATGIRGNGSEALVPMMQFGPNYSSPATLQVASRTSSSWQLSSPLERNPGGVLSGVTITPSGPVYGAWVENRRTPTANAEVYVSRYAGGSTWTPVGGSLNHNETHSVLLGGPTIANVGSVPWVAWQEAPDNAIWVARLDGGQVSYVGPSIPVGYDFGASPSLTSVNGVAYLAYSDPERLHVVTLENGRWTDVPGLVAPHGISGTITNVAGRIFVAWAQPDANGHAQLHAARYVGNGHWITDQSLNIDANESVLGASIASVAGVPWIEWTESSHPYADSRVLNNIYVKQFNGATWNQAGDVLNVDVNQSAYGDGITDIAGKAYVAMTQSQTDGGTAVRVKYYQSFRPFASGLTTAQTTNTGSRAIEFRIALSGSATVRLDFTQAVNGRLDRGVCVAATQRNAGGRACTLNVSRGVLGFHGRAGVNTLTFDGTLANHKRLKRGTYQAVVTALDASGLSSASRSVRVTI